MSDPDAEGETDDDPPDEDYEEIPLGRRTVLDGHRLSIPLARLGVEPGDVVDAVIKPVDPDTDAFAAPDLVIKGRGSPRITIPPDQWKQYEIDPGDEVDLYVHVQR